MKIDGSDAKKDRGTNEQPKTLRQQLLAMSKEFERALPDKIGVDRMMRIAMTAMQKTPHLDECVPSTFFGALMTALQMGLEPNTPLGQCYLIPRKKQQTYLCSFEMGYQGMLELAYRTKEYRYIQAEIVYKGDDFRFKYGTNRHLDHDPQWQSQEPAFVYAIYELLNGGTNFAVWSWEAVMAHAQQFSESFHSQYSPWQANQTSKEEMAKKTVLKALLKYGPKSVELAHDVIRAASVDGVTVQAQRQTVDGESSIQFEVTYPALEAPNEAERDFMNRINRVNMGMPEKEPAPVAASKGQARGRQEAEQPTKPTPAPASATYPPSAPAPSNRTPGTGLFSPDEQKDLEVQYEREQTGPQFAD